MLYFKSNLQISYYQEKLHTTCYEDSEIKKVKNKQTKKTLPNLYLKLSACWDQHLSSCCKACYVKFHSKVASIGLSQSQTLVWITGMPCQLPCDGHAGSASHPNPAGQGWGQHRSWSHIITHIPGRVRLPFSEKFCPGKIKVQILFH